MEKLKFKMLYSDLKSDLVAIEKELKYALDSRSPLLEEASLHLLLAGGKRIRPVFVLLAAKFGHYSLEQMKNIAVPLELIHMASLVHDDVIDDANVRRGRETVKAQWNNRVAMYTGDFMFARALEYMTKISNQKAHEVLAKCMLDICVGEIIQIEDKKRIDQNFRDYLRRIKRKTALLISTSCQIGAVVAGADSKTVHHLKKFGYFVGMSFQITDDLLDFTATEKQLGKPAGSDLLQGNITLPILCLKEDPSYLRDIINVMEGEMNPKEVKNLIDRIRQSEAITHAKQISNLYLEKALQELEYLPDVPAKASLTEIALYIGKRKF
ncbi:heptaprenyl diphosphate synthase component II [Paenisporosarcina cavernae]|uniref:Heptaprenyl diphosphate synthase component 2 n=1 Tax=Paenisporosarcina cavernae TaxID=2320858 RepID=A0A385YTY1_9BACL|nr:heptaprenyl diphosphate synthase component II [Paenisporosarcina cavernae]AYC29387.1 heptaprenyl diphosphate synthase component II [Paenisporosarcina cavernae]